MASKINKSSVPDIAPATPNRDALLLLRIENLEAQLRQSELLRETVLEAIDTQVVMLDGEGEIAGMSARALDAEVSAIFGNCPCASNYLATCRMAAEAGEDGAFQAAVGIAAVLSGSLERFATEYRKSGPDGAQRWFTLVIKPRAENRGVVLLHDDISQRKLLEREILEISEQERGVLGKELHDGLCQYLTGTALMAAALAHELGPKPEGHKAREIARFVREAVDQTRQIALGLYPVDIGARGLAAALKELAADISHRVRCEFRDAPGLQVTDPFVAVTYFRIALEAVQMALQNGCTGKISISLSVPGAYLVLNVEDDGSAPSAPKGSQAGMSLMKCRASALGAKFEATNLPGGGMRVRCSLPLEPRRFPPIVAPVAMALQGDPDFLLKALQTPQNGGVEAAR